MEWLLERLMKLKNRKMKLIYVLIFMFLVFESKAQEFNQNLSNNVYNEMLWVASGGENPSCGYSNFVIKPTRFYVVVDVKNLNTGETKQLATFYQDLRSAVNMDRESVFNRESRKVELKSKLALERIGFDEYDLNKLQKIQTEINLREFYNKAKSEDNEEVLKAVNESNQKYYAHLLFNFGSLSGVMARSKEFMVYDKRATELFKKELIDHLLPSDFNADTKIGDVNLLNADNIESYFGEESMHHLMTMGEEGDQFDQVTILSRDKKEKITMIAYPGSPDYAFSVFKIEKAIESDGAFYTTKVGKFVTEDGIRLGMTVEEFTQVKGKPSVLANLGENKKVYNFCIVDIYNHELLEQYKLPGYFANYTFEEGVLIAFEFGFVHP